MMHFSANLHGPKHLNPILPYTNPFIPHQPSAPSKYGPFLRSTFQFRSFTFSSAFPRLLPRPVIPKPVAPYSPAPPLYSITPALSLQLRVFFPSSTLSTWSSSRFKAHPKPRPLFPEALFYLAPPFYPRSAALLTGPALQIAPPTLQIPPHRPVNSLLASPAPTHNSGAPLGPHPSHFPLAPGPAPSPAQWLRPRLAAFLGDHGQVPTAASAPAAGRGKGEGRAP